MNPNHPGLNIVTKLLFLALTVGLSACSAQQAYSGLQQGAKNDCAVSSANSSEYTRCMERLDMSYEEYEQARKEAGENTDSKHP